MGPTPPRGLSARVITWKRLISPPYTLIYICLKGLKRRIHTCYHYRFRGISQPWELNPWVIIWNCWDPHHMTTYTIAWLKETNTPMILGLALVFCLPRPWIISPWVITCKWSRSPTYNHIYAHKAWRDEYIHATRIDPRVRPRHWGLRSVVIAWKWLTSAHYIQIYNCLAWRIHKGTAPHLGPLCHNLETVLIATILPHIH